MRPSKIADRVYKLLLNYPHLRNDDNKLIANIWHQDSTKIGSSNILELYANKKLTNAESIRRSRQKLQEENSELRGESWYARHNEVEVVKEDLQDPIWNK